MAKNCPECKSYLLSAIPEDVWDVIVDEQAEQQKKNRRLDGKEEIIYRIIRKYAKQPKEETPKKQ